MRVKNKKEKKTPTTVDPVKDFEKWKKKHCIKMTRLKQQRKPTDRKHAHYVERENIQNLVNKYSEVSISNII